MNVCVGKLAGWGLLICLAAGCGGSDAPKIETPDAFPFVQAKVEMDGKIVENAIVTLQDEKNKERKIVGAFDSESDCYRFVTTEGKTKKAGVPEGTYKVVVKPGRSTRVKIPPKYGKPDTSDLTASIQPGENFLPAFQLTP
ncbi:MAG: hypothetical protein U0992_04985 [Planctomycetaceae bacterium]